jgi:two-component system NtrC family sensor kinase
MTPTLPQPPASGAPERLPQPAFRELSRTFWRGVSTAHGLGPALEAVLQEFNAHLGTRRSSVWLHDRRARELILVASSDQAYVRSAPRVAVGDAQEPAARGLRLERPQIIPPDADNPNPILISPLRGWRRALGTLVVEGEPARDRDVQHGLDLATELGRQLSVGIENVQLLEDMLRQRRLLEDTFNSLIDPVVVTDRALRVVQMNDAFAIRLRRTRAELVERPLDELVGADLAEWAARSELEPTAERGADGVRQRTLDLPELGGNFAVTMTPLINEDGEPVGLVLVARDITRQTRLEAEQEALRARLAQSEKLASLGQFVAGIAHEMNNPLQGVLGHLELLMGSTDTALHLRKDLRRIYTEADRAAKIVRNLLVFAGSQRMARRRLRIDRVLTRAVSSRSNALERARIEVVRRHGDDIPPIVGDPLLLQQAFLNILINAEHAIADTGAPGTIEISTRTSPDRQLVITTIQDSGGGIPASILPRIFDPFFTTKEVGRGTGLGLAITYGIIQEHGGTVHADNAPSGGAIFTIELPAASFQLPAKI